MPLGSARKAVKVIMVRDSFTIDLLPGDFAIAFLEPGSPLPGWAKGPDFLSVTYTPAEVSIVCDDSSVPSHVKSQRGFRCLRVLGPLDFAEVGILASLADALAQADISIFALSTYETDYLFVPGRDLEAALSALSAAGHVVRRPGAA